MISSPKNFTGTPAAPLEMRHELVRHIVADFKAVLFERHKIKVQFGLYALNTNTYKAILENQSLGLVLAKAQKFIYPVILKGSFWGAVEMKFQNFISRPQAQIIRNHVDIFLKDKLLQVLDNLEVSTWCLTGSSLERDIMADRIRSYNPDTHLVQLEAMDLKQLNLEVLLNMTHIHVRISESLMKSEMIKNLILQTIEVPRPNGPYLLLDVPHSRSETKHIVFLDKIKKYKI